MTRRRRFWIVALTPLAMLAASLFGRSSNFAGPYASFLAPDVHAQICNAECDNIDCIYSPNSGITCYTVGETGACQDEDNDCS